MSAFAPIANPMSCDWGKKAFGGYFGEENKEKWAEHDATELVKKWKGEPLDILIDVVSHRLLYCTRYLFDTRLYRAQQTTSTSKANFFLRTSSKQRRGRERSMSGGKTVMIIVTLQWRLLRMITLIMLRGIFWKRRKFAQAHQLSKGKRIDFAKVCIYPKVRNYEPMRGENNIQVT